MTVNYITKAILISTILLVINSNTLAQSDPKIETILDSLEVLKNVGGLVDGHGVPPTPEEARYNNITRMLFALPFNETKKLMTDSNKFVRVYGFSVATKKYFDSLTKTDLLIFNDTSQLLFFTKNDIIDVGITVGQYCEMGYLSTIEEHENFAKEKDVIAAIENFIKTNSSYPESYEPIDFMNYKWGEDYNGLHFEIQHKYMLKLNDGSKTEAVNYFILDNNFKIILIETTRSNTYRVDPPKLDEWTKKFGNTK